MAEVILVVAVAVAVAVLTTEGTVTSQVVGSVTISPLNSGRLLQIDSLKRQRAWLQPSPNI